MRRSGGGAAAALALVVGSCGAPPLPESEADARPFVRFEGAGVPKWSPMRERGIGVARLELGPPDTLIARASASPDADVLARLVLDTTGVFVFEAREGLLASPGALAFGYEEVGLPILERGDGWERVYLGVDSAGAPVSGWASGTGGAAITLWDQLLPEMPLFFALPPDSLGFHSAPEGPAQSFELDVDDYILWPLETRGDWMRVRAVSPSDYCAAPSAPRQDTVWIRWRTETGNPRVWFYTRGC